jgi:hypothetical protein
VVKFQNEVFSVMTPYSLLGGIAVSEKHSAYIFRMRLLEVA